MIATAIVVSGSVMIVLALVVIFVKIRKEKERILTQDSDVVKLEISRWSGFVLRRRKTIRSLKRFENQVRFLAACEDVGDDMIPSFAGICALATQEDFGADFEEWKTILRADIGRMSSIQGDLGPEGEGILLNWLAKTRNSHWDRYRKLLGRVEFIEARN